MKDVFSENGIEVTDAQIKKLDEFRAILLEYNEKFNLTNITDEEEIAVKHFVDSIKGIPYLPEKGVIADVGSGAGFPGIPLAITSEGTEREFVLIDSLLKRVNYLNAVIERLGLKRVKAVHARAEEEGRRCRESYDFAVARAVAPLNTLAEYVLPLVKVGGAFLAYKGKIGDEEKDARGAVSELGGRIAKIDKYVLAGEYERSFVLIEKIKPTPTKYPRGQNKPRILPL